jgi:hypothetical protein
MFAVIFAVLSVSFELSSVPKSEMGWGLPVLLAICYPAALIFIVRDLRRLRGEVTRAMRWYRLGTSLLFTIGVAFAWRVAWLIWLGPLRALFGAAA